MEHAREILCIEPAFEQDQHLLTRCLLEIVQLDNPLDPYCFGETDLVIQKNLPYPFGPPLLTSS